MSAAEAVPAVVAEGAVLASPRVSRVPSAGAELLSYEVRFSVKLMVTLTTHCSWICDQDWEGSIH